MILLEWLICATALLVFLPSAVLSVEVLLARGGRLEQSNNLRRPLIAVLIPAHNEASGIEETIQALTPQLLPGDRIIVIADNCTDETGEIACSSGAEVLVRNDTSRRGKSYALDFAIRHLEQAPPKIVVVVDADCHVTSGGIAQLVGICAQANRPAQAAYTMVSRPGASAAVHVAEFAFLLKNWIRPLGLRRLGLPCQLMGTGMALPWACIHKVRLDTGHIVEDLKLGLDLAESGAPPLFVPTAKVTSRFPSSTEGVKTQRTRWEHGYLSVLLADAPRMIGRALMKRDALLLAMAIDLSVPPIALLVLLASCVWLAALTLYLLGGGSMALLVASISVALISFSVIGAWARFARDILPLGSLPSIASYAFKKLPLYGRFVVARQTDWVRSKRDDDPPP